MKRKGREKRSKKEKKDEREIYACMRCGSTNVRWLGKLKDTPLIWWGISQFCGLVRCEDCGYEGFPILFKSEKAYLKFLKERGERKIKVEGKEKIKAPISTNIIFLVIKLIIAFSAIAFVAILISALI